MPNSENNQKKNLFYAISLGLELGFLIVIPLVVFVVLGIFLDRKFNTSPIFLLISIALSFISTVFEVRYLILPFLNKKVGKK